MTHLTIQQAFELAQQHHRAGRLKDAEQLYRQILTQQPNHAGALHYQGVIAYQVGRRDVAVELIHRAIALEPDCAEAHSNLGNVLGDNGELDEAIDSYRRAIALEPDFAQAYFNLGNALKNKQQVDQAIAAYRKAIDFQPDYAQAYSNLGNALRDKGLLDEAIAALGRAIALSPEDAAAHNALGVALSDKGEFDQAIAEYRRAIDIRPNLAEAHNNLGIALRGAGQIDQALAAFRNAIALDPNSSYAHSNLGITLKKLGQLDESIAECQKAIALSPRSAEIHLNLGTAFKAKGQLDEAIAATRTAISLSPDLTEAHSNLLHEMLLHPAFGPEQIAQELRRWNSQHAQPLRKLIQPHHNDASPDRRLRVGYVSSDFLKHASAHFLVPLLESHDPQQVELICYAQVPRPDAITQRLQRRTAQWRSTVGLSDQQVANQIREDRIDILVDLKLHTSESRLLIFARKPAPVQVAWLGYPGSTGLTAIDYRLSDPYLDPVGMDESVYSEKTIRLPDTFWCYDPLDGRDVPVNRLPALDSGLITFGCLNNFSKVNQTILTLWAQVLGQVQRSRLLLLSPHGSHRQWTLDQLQKHGIDPERIEFASARPRREYLRLYNHIDIGLDSFPYNGHTTSLDSFWMGVPVVTLLGQTAVSRAGWCQLSNLKLSELAGHAPDQFVQIAVNLANDLPRLQSLRSTLRQRMEQSPLMDAPRFARNVEAAYRQMWHTYCAAVRRDAR